MGRELTQVQCSAQATDSTIRVRAIRAVRSFAAPGQGLISKIDFAGVLGSRVIGVMDGNRFDQLPSVYLYNEPLKRFTSMGLVRHRVLG